MKKILIFTLLFLCLFLTSCEFMGESNNMKKEENNNEELDNPVEEPKDDEKEEEKQEEKEEELVKNDGNVCVAYFYGTDLSLSKEAIATLDIINYCFGEIVCNTIDGKKVYSIDVSWIEAINRIKKYHDNGIKVCLSLGGWQDDSSFWNTYSDAASTDENRKMVANSILETLEKYDLDGIDMDWEYPKSTDKNNFTLLMTEIKNTLKAKRCDYLITAAIPGGTWTNQRYDYAALNNVLDYFYVMTYDLDFDGSGKSNHVTTIKATFDSAQYLKSQGVNPKKIVLGAAFYGRRYTIDEEGTKHGLGMTYNKIETINYNYIQYFYVEKLNDDIKKYYDEVNDCYYIYDSKNKQFISYEDVLAIKSKWEKAKEYGGIMFWSYQNDTTNTLINALYEARFNK